ncbi:NTP transferase domain-containing protein [Candidatus Woesearchaeota archaeon]|nr:NTP transferase domain-containing protein [Candidatus Woesearchaeota archaeon]
MKERVTLTIEKNLLAQIDGSVDGMTIKNRSHAVELYLRRALQGRVPTKALILAGGKGSRMLPLTKNTPKPLLEIQGASFLEHNIQLLKRFGVRDIILSIGYLKEQIKEKLGDGGLLGVNITYIDENPEKPLGTAGPIRKAKEYLQDGSFLVLNADELKDINLEMLYKEHLKNEAAATIALTTVKDPSLFGVAMLDGNRIIRFVEKPSAGTAPSKLINAGMYIFEPSIIDIIPSGYAMIETDVFPKLARDGKLYGYPFAGQWFVPESPEWLPRIEKEWEGYKA